VQRDTAPVNNVVVRVDVRSRVSISSPRFGVASATPDDKNDNDNDEENDNGEHANRHHVTAHKPTAPTSARTSV
jgi:hypothetical protein